MCCDWLGAEFPPRAPALKSTSVDAELIDRIYECGFVPELWPQGETVRVAVGIFWLLATEAKPAHEDRRP
jgi:hypothetical protein